MARTPAARRLEYATDYGKIRNHPPAAVGVPTSAGELQDCLELARSRDLKLVARGGGYSFLGQSLARDHMVLDLKRLDTGRAPRHNDGNLIDVKAGMGLWDVQDHLTARGFRLPVMTSAGKATIGGTLSIGGLSGRSYRRGFLVRHVRRFRLLGTDGRIWECSPDENPLLFNTALACQGMLGFVLDATIGYEPLLPYRSRLIVGDVPARKMYDVARRLRDYPEAVCLEGYIDWHDVEPTAQVHATIEAATAEDAERGQERWTEIMDEQGIESYELEIFDIDAPIKFSASVGGWDLTQALEGDKTANETVMLLPLGFVLREEDAADALSELGAYAREQEPMFIGNSYFSMLDSMADSEQIWVRLDERPGWVMGIDMLLHCDRSELDELLRQCDDVWEILGNYRVRTYPYGAMPRRGLLHTLTPDGMEMMREAAALTDPDERLLHRELFLPEMNAV